MAPSIITGLPPSQAKQSTPKTMSSRLMTMKFMQRGAAAAAASPVSPSSPATPQSADSSTSKRRKFSHAVSTTSTPATPLYDQKAIQAAIEEEEKKRLAAVEKRAAELGDSHWVLPGAFALPNNGARTLNVVTVGFAQIDYPAASGRDDDNDDNPFEEGAAPPPSAQIRRFNMKTKKQEKQEDSGEKSDSSSDSNSDSEEGQVEEDETSPKYSKKRQASITDSSETKNRRRSIVPSRKLEEQKKAAEFAGKRRAKEIKLNQLSSISGGGASQPRSPAILNCHSCGNPGHKAIDCPNKNRRR
ncbi:hypothetical protein QBC38DRAFT_507192 [Podospora fimiseda]|uniref:CCHC-type domain-containing protein n=1 Tax=Podospora fimiseda TaxID=252190 RepID=A0AAN7BWC7_9PEZI|nr:hypothetical protein QBC38DRAFT_507192 [Podospora fimiseda]